MLLMLLSSGWKRSQGLESSQSLSRDIFDLSRDIVDRSRDKVDGEHLLIVVLDVPLPKAKKSSHVISCEPRGGDITYLYVPHIIPRHYPSLSVFVLLYQSLSVIIVPLRFFLRSDWTRADRYFAYQTLHYLTSNGNNKTII